MNEIIVTGTTPEFINKNLQKATNDMFKVGEKIRKCALVTAVIMAQVDELECYKDDGFSSVHEWSMKTFGFKKSASYTLLKIGKEYVREIVNPKNGRITGYESNLVEVGADKDFTTTQIEKMLPGGHDLAKELVSNGEITPDMTCKEIDRVIKKHTQKDDTNTVDGTEEPEESEVTEEDKEETLICVWDADGNKYEIPFSILTKYAVE